MNKRFRPEQQETALEFRDVTYTHKGSQSAIFQHVQADVKQGEFVSLLGPSGSGKSTFFRLAAGLSHPEQGTVFLHNSVPETRLGRVGYMPQQDLLLPWRTILENGMLPLEINGVPKKEAARKVSAHLKAFGLDGVENQYPHELSGGMRQRVSFLRAVVGGSDILMLDEPFSALDSITRFMMQEWLLEQWQAAGQTLVFITHDIEEALFLSDRILLFTQPPIEGRFTEITVPLPRPRKENDRDHPELLKLKRELINRMRGEGGII